MSSIDLGQLGKYNLDTKINAAVNIFSNSRDFGNSFEGDIEVLGETKSFKAKIDVTTQTLDDLAHIIEDKLKSIVTSAYNDGTQYAKAVKDGTITGIENVADVLRHEFGLTASNAAQALESTGYTVDETGDLLKKSYELSYKEMFSALIDGGYALNEVCNFLVKAYNVTYKDMFDLLIRAGKDDEYAASFVYKKFHPSASDLLELLTGNGDGIDSAMRLIYKLYRPSLGEMIKILTEDHFNDHELVSVLKEIYNPIDVIAALGGGIVNKTTESIDKAGDTVKKWGKKLGDIFGND